MACEAVLGWWTPPPTSHSAQLQSRQADMRQAAEDMEVDGNASGAEGAAEGAMEAETSTRPQSPGVLDTVKGRKRAGQDYEHPSPKCVAVAHDTSAVHGVFNQFIRCVMLGTGGGWHPMGPCAWRSGWWGC